MKDHKAELTYLVKDYKVLGEIAAMKDFDLVCQSILQSMGRGETVVMIMAPNLREIRANCRPYYRNEMKKMLAEIGEFEIKLGMEKTLSDSLIVSWD